MNMSAKCNCCVCEAVCKYKDIYQNGVESVLNTTINSQFDEFWKLRDCPHIEVSIKCPHMIVISQKKGVTTMENELKPCEMVTDNPMDYVRVALALETLAYHNKNYLAKCLGDNCEISREIQSLLIKALKESERGQ